VKAAALVCFTVVAAGQQPANPDAVTQADFDKRVTEYVKLHKSLESKLPKLKPTPSPEEISHHEHELREKIRHERRAIAPGNIFTPQIAAEFRRLIGIAMQGAGAARVEQSLKNAEPVQLRLTVNSAYPAGVPLQSTPPTLLLNLPKLPQEVAYRVVDHELVLLDVKANLVVDFMTYAIP
jgi:hypothetical protein